MDKKINKYSLHRTVLGGFPLGKYFLGLISLIIVSFAYAGYASASYQSEGTAFYANASSYGYVYENTAFYAFNSQVTDSVPVYRFANTKNGDHFYTISENEKTAILNNSQGGYVLEGIAFYAFNSQITDSLPVYRFLNSTNGDHFYTTSESEKTTLLNNPQWGYALEGVAFYAFSSQITDSMPVYRFLNTTNGDHFYTTSEDEKNNLSTVPVYRFLNSTNGDHFYTISEAEKNAVNNTPQSGYFREGIAFYAFNSQITDSLPVYRFLNSVNGDHFYTISEDEKTIILNNPQWGYALEGVAFYAFFSQIGNSLPVYRFVNSTNGDHFYTISEAEKNYLETPLLGPDIAVGLWNYTKSEIQSSAFQIDANKNYKIKDKNGAVLAEISASSTTKVTYDANSNLKVYNSLPAVLANSNVTFEAADGNNTDLIFNVHRPDSSLDRYRGKIKVQYYHGGDVYGGNPSSTVSQIWIINILPLEHYVWGDGELAGTGNINHTRVMASIFRTYGYWYVKYSTKYAGYGFKIRSDSGSQIYSGYDWETGHPNIKTAAQNTRGIIMSYGNDVALTPYSSWSDGRTRSYQERWGSTNYPWCQSVADPYGKDSSRTTAQLETDGNHMVGLIAHGSLNLADDPYNWDYQRILKYYYTGISTNPAY